MAVLVALLFEVAAAPLGQAAHWNVAWFESGTPVMDWQVTSFGGGRYRLLRTQPEPFDLIVERSAGAAAFYTVIQAESRAMPARSAAAAFVALDKAVPSLLPTPSGRWVIPRDTVLTAFASAEPSVQEPGAEDVRTESPAPPPEAQSQTDSYTIVRRPGGWFATAPDGTLLVLSPR